MSSDLRQLRTQAGLSQSELARLAGVTQTTISHLERDLIDPRLSTVTRIKQAIDTYTLAHPLGVCAVSAVQEGAEGVGFLSGDGQ